MRKQSKLKTFTYTYFVTFSIECKEFLPISIAKKNNANTCLSKTSIEISQTILLYTQYFKDITFLRIYRELIPELDLPFYRSESKLCKENKTELGSNGKFTNSRSNACITHHTHCLYTPSICQWRELNDCIKNLRMLTTTKKQHSAIKSDQKDRFIIATE